MEAAGSGIERVVKVCILLVSHGMRICSLFVSVHHIHHFHGELQGGQRRVWPVFHAQAGTIMCGCQGTTVGRTCRDRSHRFGRLGMMRMADGQIGLQIAVSDHGISYIAGFLSGRNIIMYLMLINLLKRPKLRGNGLCSSPSCFLLQ